MRSLAIGLFALVSVTLAALYWIAVAQIAFSLTGSDPADLARTGGFATPTGLAAVAVFGAGLVAYALVSRAYFRFRRGRLARG